MSSYIEKIVLDGTELIVKDAQCESDVIALSQQVSGLSSTVTSQGTAISNLSGTVSSHSTSISSLQTTINNKIGIVELSDTTQRPANTRGDYPITYSLPAGSIITGVTVSTNYPSWAQVNVGNITNNGCTLGISNEYNQLLAITYVAKIAYYIP